MTSVVDEPKKILRLHSDSTAKDRLSEQTRGFEQINVVNNAITIEPIKAKLGWPGF